MLRNTIILPERRYLRLIDELPSSAVPGFNFGVRCIMDARLHDDSAFFLGADGKFKYVELASDGCVS